MSAGSFFSDDHKDAQLFLVESHFGFAFFVTLFAIGLYILKVILGVFLRHHIREKFSIEEPGVTSVDDILSDVLVVGCCYDCVMCQEKSTVDQLTSRRIPPARLDRV